MYNNYTIELKENNTEVRATIYLSGNSLGTVWVPDSKLVTKQDFETLFKSIADVIYGSENKAKEEEKSYIEGSKALKAKDKAFIKGLQ